MFSKRSAHLTGSKIFPYLQDYWTYRENKHFIIFKYT